MYFSLNNDGGREVDTRVKIILESTGMMKKNARKTFLHTQHHRHILCVTFLD